MSESEDPGLRSSLEPHFNITVAAGAGYKLLSLATGMADIYLLSKDSTHYWDTCGPHAILKSLGGGILNFQKLQRNQNESNNGLADQSSSLNTVQNELNYRLTNPGAKESHFANMGGILAFRDINVAFSVLECLGIITRTTE
jgi:inositol polyphosphate 1-phosphatase